MPEPGWTTISVRDELYESVAALAKELDRSISWVATKSLEHAVSKCIPEAGAFDPAAAEQLGLR